MDREVAASWLDETRPVQDFRFVPYLKNVPDRDEDIREQSSYRSSLFSDELDSESQYIK